MAGHSFDECHGLLGGFFSMSALLAARRTMRNCAMGQTARVSFQNTAGQASSGTPATYRTTAHRLDHHRRLGRLDEIAAEVRSG